jgi:hypothetical protein
MKINVKEYYFDGNFCYEEDINEIESLLIKFKIKV